MSHGTATNMQMKHSLLSFHGKGKMTDAVFVIKSFIDGGGGGGGGGDRRKPPPTPPNNNNNKNNFSFPPRSLEILIRGGGGIVSPQSFGEVELPFLLLLVVVVVGEGGEVGR